MQDSRILTNRTSAFGGLRPTADMNDDLTQYDIILYVAVSQK